MLRGWNGKAVSFGSIFLSGRSKMAPGPGREARPPGRESELTGSIFTRICTLLLVTERLKRVNLLNTGRLKCRT